MVMLRGAVLIIQKILGSSMFAEVNPMAKVRIELDAFPPLDHRKICRNPKFSTFAGFLKSATPSCHPFNGCFHSRF